MVKRHTKAKRSAQDASLSDQSSLTTGEQVPFTTTNTQTNIQSSNECGDSQTQSRVNVSNTPRITDQLSSTRMWSKLSDKMDRQHELMRELNESTRKQIIECEERIVKTFESKLQIMEKEISYFKEKICALESVAGEINIFRKELTMAMEKVTRLESETGEIQNLKNEIQTLKLKMQRQENNIVASDLRINGVPYVENENLISIFNEICKVVNIEIPAIKSIFRLKNQNNKRDNNSPDAVIIVRMWSPYDKNFFLKILSSFKKNNKDFYFRLRQIGFDSNSPFFVNENLTQTNYQILQAAVRLKRQKRLHSAFTIRGLVYVKRQPDDKAFRIDEYDQLSRLDMFFPDHHGSETVANHGETNFGQEY